MSIKKIQSGDKVIIIAGGHKGKVGQVTNVRKKKKNSQIKTFATVSGVPRITKYIRSTKNQEGQIPGAKYEVDRWIHISNLAIVDSENKPSRVKIIFQENGKKVRALQKDGTILTKNRIQKVKPSKNISNQLQSQSDQ